MTLKQLNDVDRILFLQDFTKELVINSGKELGLKLILETEKIKRKYIDEEPQNIEKIDKFFNKEYQKSIGFEEHEKREKIEMAPLQRRLVYHPRIHKPLQKDKLIRKEPQQVSRQPLEVSRSIVQQKPSVLHSIGQGYSKIDSLIKDISVQMIECPGAGKNVIVRVRNRLNTTKIILNESEIKEVINHFASQARIPVVGGILKAAVGDLIVSAVISELIGSRFIINKKSPYSLIEGVEPLRR